MFASMRGSSATTTTTAATAATRKTAEAAGVGMTPELVAGTVRAAPVVEVGTVLVKRKTRAGVVISSDAPVDSVSGCVDLQSLGCS